MLCQEIKPSKTKPLIRLLSERSEKPTIFFIHPIGGKVFWYNNLSETLSPFFQCYGIESIFLNQKYREINTLEDLSSIYAQEILDTKFSGPLILCGWSFGGTLAYEISHFLINSGYEIQGTIIIDQDSSTDHDRIQKEISEIENVYEDMSINEDLRCKYMHYKCLLKYEISPQISKIVFFKSEQLDVKKLLGWEKYCKNFQSYTIGKDHFSILEKDNVSFVAEKIKLAFLEKI
jgi:thioesterase domain-containing protein